MGLNVDTLDEETKKKIIDLQNLQNNLEFIMNQRLQVETQIRETEMAIEALTNADDDALVYKSIGGILVKSEKNKLLNEKKSIKATLDMRKKSLESKETRVKQQFETMRKSFQADLMKFIFSLPERYIIFSLFDSSIMVKSK